MSFRSAGDPISSPPEVEELEDRLSSLSSRAPKLGGAGIGGFSGALPDEDVFGEAGNRGTDCGARRF